MCQIQYGNRDKEKKNPFLNLRHFIMVIHNCTNRFKIQYGTSAFANGYIYSAIND